MFSIVFLFITFLSVSSYSMDLSQDLVIQKVLNNSLEYQKIQAYEKTIGKEIAAAEEFLDWRFFLQADLSSQKQNTLNFFENPLQEQQRFLFGLEKKFSTGTQVKFQYSLFQFEREFSSEFKKISSPPTATFRHKMGLEMEQDILRNIFGYEDRLKLSIASHQTEVQKIKLLEETEDLILQSVQQFWKTYISYLSLQLKISKKKDYRDLARITKEKGKYGYLRPGELSQIRAEWEQAKQDVTLQRLDYKNQLKILFNLLNDQPTKNINFITNNKTPSVPVLNKNLSQTPRKVLLMKKYLLIQKQQLKMLKSTTWPTLKLFVSYNIGGYDKNFSSSLEGLKDGKNQDYSIGVKFSYPLPSTRTRRKRIAFGEQAVEASQLEVKITNKEFERLISSTQENLYTLYEALKSVEKVHRYRSLSYKDIRKAFLQGRLGVFELISAKEFSLLSEIQRAQFTARYWQALIYAQAIRDELISAY